jgi:hypothetical protein
VDTGSASQKIVVIPAKAGIHIDPDLRFVCMARAFVKQSIDRCQDARKPEWDHTKSKELDSGLTRAILALALRASSAVRARSCARSRRK